MRTLIGYLEHLERRSINKRKTNEMNVSRKIQNILKRSRLTALFVKLGTWVSFHVSFMPVMSFL
jgi:hypothetical protein